ncbi:MFS transporter, partial [Roseibium sp. RKSG952]|uniref:MFS transporter n=1 Tax=Roseibium sp. RKSG952 TaxID=2529384 RepID=UPI0012BD1B92
AAGYLARPLGAFIFGHIGDTVGRKNVLIISIMMMGISTALIGILPTTDQIGATAGLLLVLLRIVQGISVGGEFSGSIVFLAEHALPSRRGFATSMSNAGSIAGFILGSGVVTGMAYVFSDAQLTDGIWRYAFLSGIVIMIIGIVLRRSLILPEHIEPEDKVHPGRSPAIVAIRNYWTDILRVAALAASANVSFYIVFVFSAAYLASSTDLSTAVAMELNTFTLFVQLATIPVSGLLSDRFGRRRVLMIGNGLLLLLAFPMMLVMSHPDAGLIVLGQVGFAILIGGLQGTNPIMMAEIPSKGVRVSVVSIGHNLALALFGGTAPAVATFLVQKTGHGTSPAIYIMVFALAAFLSLLLVKTTRGKDLQ